MPFALIPDGYSLKKVTKLQKRAIDEKRMHDDTIALLNNPNTPLVVGAAAASFFSIAIMRIVVACCLLATSVAVARRARPMRAPTSRKSLRDAEEDGLETVTPNVVAASHNCAGYGPECVVDGNDRTFWLVPGGQRMEMMSYAARPLQFAAARRALSVCSSALP